MKKHLFRVVVLMLALVMLAACGTVTPSNSTPATSNAPATSNTPSEDPGTEESRFNAPGEFPVFKETIPLTIAIQASTNVEDYDTNGYTQLLRDRVNVDITFELLPSAEADAKQKLALSAASGAKLADIYIVSNLTTAEVYGYGTQGTFIPLTDLYEKHGHYIYEAMERNDNDNYTIPMITMPDGNIYTIPFANYVRSGPYTMLGWINKTWLDKVGHDVPTTTEEYYQALKAFKEQDPNGNGKADEIPLTGNGLYNHHGNPFLYLMNSFIYTQATTYLSVNDGVISVPFDKPEWLEGLQYMNKLVSEGLMDPAIFTQDEAQFKALIDYESDAIVGSFSAVGFVVYKADSIRKQDMVSMAPLTGPNGVGYTHYLNPTPASKYFITKDCADPEAAFLLGDYMMSYEASAWNRFGEPEVDYTIVDKSLGVFSAINPNVRTVLSPILVWGSVQNVHWMEGAPKYRGFEDIDLAWSGDPWDQNYVKANALKGYLDKVPEEAINTLIYNDEELVRIAELNANLLTFVEETATRLITGNESFNFWETYLNELKKLGIDEYVRLSQAAYDRMHGK